MDFAAVLGMQVESSDLGRADAALDRLALTGERVEARVGSSMIGVTTAMRQVAVNTEISAERASRQTRQAVGNLTYQITDVAQMLAAGQSPFLLMMQQGEQMSGALRDLSGAGGRGGVIGGFGSALKNLLNPISLATFATIGFGAYAVQWFTKTGEAAKSMADQVKGVEGSFKEFESFSKTALAPLGELADKYGAAAEKARELARALAESEGIRLRMEVGEVMSGASLDFGLQNVMKGLQPQFLADYFNLDRPFMAFTEEARSLRAKIDTHISEVIESTNQMYASKSASIADQAQALERMIAAYRDAAKLDGDLSASENTYLENLGAVLDKLYQQLEIEKNLASSKAERSVFDAGEIKSAQEKIVALRRQAELNEIIAVHGADSSEATSLRAQQERVAFVEQAKSAEISEVLKTELVEAYDAAVLLSGVDFATGIGLGAAQAELLGDKLRDAANAWLEARSLDNLPQNVAMMKYGSRATTDSRPIEANFEIPKAKKSGGSSSASSSINPVSELIEKLKEELLVSRQLGEVQQEMAGHREVLSKATKEEKTLIEELITQRIAEKKETESLQFVAENTGDALVNALMGGVNAGEQLIQTLKRAALEAFLLGKGPLSGLTGGGGMLSSLFGAAGGTGGASGGGMLGGLLGTSTTATAAGSGLMGGLSNSLGGGLSNVFSIGANATAAGGGLMAGLGAAIAPLAVAAAVFSFFKKKTTLLDEGLEANAEGFGVSAKNYALTETSQFWGLSKKKRTVLEDNFGLSDSIKGVQSEIMGMADELGVSASVFNEFSYRFKLSLKNLSEEQKVAAVAEELSKLGDAFASMIPNIANFTELTEVLSERYSLEARLLQLQGNVVELRRLEMESVHEYNRALLQEIYDLTDAKELERQAAELERQATERQTQAMNAARAMREENFATSVEFRRAQAMAQNAISAGSTLDPKLQQLMRDDTRALVDLMRAVLNENRDATKAIEALLREQRAA